jgi:hypothetical protein
MPPGKGGVFFFIIYFEGGILYFATDILYNPLCIFMCLNNGLSGTKREHHSEEGTE